ncbi:hypothetical protein AB0L82_01680 [Nocardia sp. NPDC052001]|uniref:hypothetical protein n=1 Tax=Nocardia sp. NPDC052001 TaxID=3154853 RepID=UPI00344A5490
MTDHPIPGTPLPNPLPGMPAMAVPDDASGGETGVDQQPAFNSVPQTQDWRDRINDGAAVALGYFDSMKEPLAASLLRRYLGKDEGGTLGTDYVFSDRQMDRIIHAPSVQNTINHGQWIELVDGKWHSSDTPGAPGTVYQRGLNDEVADAITRARTDHSLYGQQQNVVVPWMNTTVEQDDQNRNDLSGTGHDIHDSLGKFHTGATGRIVVTPVDPANPDGPVKYTMDYGIHVWDFEKFNQTPTDDAGYGSKEKIVINNNIGRAHELGLGRQFQDYGTSGLRSRSAVVGADGRPIGNVDDGYKSLQAWQEGGPLTIQPWRQKPWLSDYLKVWFAQGGDVRGPGSSIGDKIPAFLSDGEFVVNAASASANRPLLKAINDDPTYMAKYAHQMETMVATALTKVRAPSRSPGGTADQSMRVHVSAYDVHEAFAKAKLWEQRHHMGE